jgi:hypothetical protein
MKKPVNEVDSAERRRATRHVVHERVEMRLELGVVEGETQNISADGINFFADAPLEVSIIIKDGQSSRTIPGHIVRVESVTQSRIAVAVRFQK